VRFSNLYHAYVYLNIIMDYGQLDTFEEDIKRFDRGNCNNGRLVVPKKKRTEYEKGSLSETKSMCF
jgi:hypothetical protein